MGQKLESKLSSIEIDALTEIQKLILTNLDLDSIFDKALTLIIDRTGLLGGVLVLKEGDTAVPRAVSMNPTASRFLKMIPREFSLYSVPLETASNNLIVQSIITGKVQSSFRLIDFTRGVFTRRLTSAVAVATNTRSAISIPLVVENETIGAIFFSKAERKEFSEELSFLKLITSQLEIAIANASLYEQLQESLQNVKELNREQQDLMDIVSHELKNPLTVIKGSLEVMQRKSTPQVIKNDLYKDIDKAVNDQIRILASLKKARDVGSNRLKAKKEVVNVEEFLESRINHQRKQLESSEWGRLKLSKIELVLKNSIPQGFTIRTDTSLLADVLNNLLSNAFKYTDSGKITLKASLGPRKITISVIDSGIGISNDQQQRVWNKFYRINNDSRTNASPLENQGLGLYIAKVYIKKLGGEIKLDSKLGKGSKFIITLPT